MAEPVAYFDKRSVRLAIEQLKSALQSMRNLDALQRDRSLSVAITEVETGVLWLQELEHRAPEGL